MFILPLGGHPDLGWLNPNIPYNDISIEIWLHLIQNNFIGTQDAEFCACRYKVKNDCNVAEAVHWFKYTHKRNGIFVFYKYNLSQQLWNTIMKTIPNKIVIGLTTKTNIQDENIILLADPKDKYERDFVKKSLNKILLVGNF
jgi:hypothetical protein